MSHTHIGPGDWACVARMLRTGHSLSEIARTIGKDVSSVSRHVAEYGGRDGYDTREVRRKKRMKRITAMESTRVVLGLLLRFIIKELKQHKSLEQIAGVLARKKKAIAPSTIYRYLNERAPHLRKYLRSQKGKYRRRRGTKERENSREQRKKRRIDERPAVVERRGRLGDFEGDTLMGRDKRVRIVSFVDRRSGYLIAFLLLQNMVFEPIVFSGSLAVFKFAISVRNIGGICAVFGGENPPRKFGKAAEPHE